MDEQHRSRLLQPALTPIAVLFLFFFVAPSQASVGDRYSYFQDCIAFCRSDLDCPIYPFAYAWTTSRCFKCRRQCMEETIGILDSHGYPLPQFYGKWPFASIEIDVAGWFVLIQEPASVLFSLGNLLTVMRMHTRVSREIDDDYRIKFLWQTYTHVGSAVWIASSLFHARDFWLTEVVDYIAACALIFFAFFVAISFTCPALQTTITGIKAWTILGIAVILFYGSHIFYLLSNFDYRHNMFYCIVLSAATAVIYLTWAGYEVFQGRGRSSMIYMLAVIVFALLGGVFEVFDFPPVFGIFDAHAIFHAMTIPTPLFLAEFVIREAHHEFEELKKSKLF